LINARNAELCKDVKQPTAIKTGTTIGGIVFKDGLVLGGDTKATEGPIVADNNCEKVHYLAPNMYCCGAGTAADNDFMTSLIASKLELHRLQTNRQNRVVTAMTMMKQMLFKYFVFYIGIKDISDVLSFWADTILMALNYTP
jgi:20S proteasome subunit beta 2